MDKPIHIYKSVDSRNPKAEYYTVFLAPYGMIGSIHGFDCFPDGIITMMVTPHVAYDFEVRRAFNEFKSNHGLSAS